MSDPILADTITLPTMVPVQVAVFTSADQEQGAGYQIVARSGGVDRETAQAISRWSSTQPPHPSCRMNCFSGYPLSRGRMVLSRTIDGGPEYSCRGGVRWVTVALIFEAEHAQQFAFHPIRMLRTAMALGLLRLPFATPVGLIDPAEFPSRSWTGPKFRERMPAAGTTPDAEGASSVDAGFGDANFVDGGFGDAGFVDAGLQAMAQRIVSSGSAAWTDSPCPDVDAETFFDRMSIKDRGRLAWAIGLLPSRSRPFQAYFIGELDAATRRTFAMHQIACFGMGDQTPAPAIRR